MEPSLCTQLMFSGIISMISMNILERAKINSETIIQIF